jgi:FemAB-related protein (PEP-CTERM system-associated)
MTEVREYAEDQREAWDAYVDGHPLGTLFHLTAWKRAVERTFGHRAVYLWAERGGAPVGVLPLFVVPTLKGRALVSVPYGVYGGIVADDAATAGVLLEAARAAAEREKAKYVELRSREASGLDLPTTDLYVAFERDLPSTPEECLGTIPRKSRASVRNGRSKFGVRSEFTQDFTKLYDLYAANVRRLGSPTFPFRFLLNLREAYGAGRLDVMHTLFEDRVVSSVLNFYYKDAVVPYYSGTDESYFFTQCANVMYCDLMEEGVRRGYRKFDFGRSRRDSGPYHFKSNMGFEPRTLGYQYVLRGLKEVPSINPSNPRFELPRRIWSRLPLGVTKVVGPQLLRYIP